MRGLKPKGLGVWSSAAPKAAAGARERMHVAGPRLRILAAAKVEGAARHLGFRGDEVRRRHVTKGRGTEETANEAADLFNQATATAQGKSWLASRRVTVCDSSRSRQGSNKERSRPHWRNESE